MLHEVCSEIGFADGEILSLERLDGEVVVKVSAWNNIELKVTFVSAILLCDLMNRDVSGLYYYDEKTELLVRALKYTYTSPIETQIYKHFAFLNHDGEACLDVVAVDVKITTEHSSTHTRVQ